MMPEREEDQYRGLPHARERQPADPVYVVRGRATLAARQVKPGDSGGEVVAAWAGGVRYGLLRAAYA